MFITISPIWKQSIMSEDLNNHTNINLLCQQHRTRLDKDAKETLAKLVYLYTRKLIDACVEVNAIKGKITLEDVRYIYQADKGIKSPLLASEQLERRQKTIQAVNRTPLKEFEQNTEIPQNEGIPSLRLGNIQTVRLVNEGYSHMQTHPNFQLTIKQNSAF